MYYLRDKDGSLKATFSDRSAYRVMEDSKGYHKTVEYKKGDPKLTFVFESDYTFGADDLQVFIWIGDKLVKQ